MSEEQEDGIDVANFPSNAERKERKQKPAQVVTVDQPAEQMVPISQIAELIKAMQQSQGITPETLKTILSEVGKDSATAMQSAITRQNPNYVSRSPYTREDGSKPTPKRDVFFGPQGQGRGWRLDPESLTVIEIDLCNQFERGRKQARDGQWTADVVLNGTQEELYVKVPMSTSDQRQDLPAFSSILRELLGGAKAADPNALAERVAELEKQLAAQKEAVPA